VTAGSLDLLERAAQTTKRKDRAYDNLAFDGFCFSSSLAGLASARLESASVSTVSAAASLRTTARNALGIGFHFE
jgi:hypothetical protein